MEIVLGIDNLVFISILTDKLATHQKSRVRRIGLSLALILRIALLFAISWLMRLTQPWFSVGERSMSGRDLILLLGGLFLIGKATLEVYEKLEVEHETHGRPGKPASASSVLVQILVLDVVFSLDSVITAVGMAQKLWVMVVAMLVAVGVMLIFANAVSDFVLRHPSMKILALSFLLLIGVMLVAEGMGQHISKGYIYFAMAFSLLVELFNMRFRKKQVPVVLHERYEKNG